MPLRDLPAVFVFSRSDDPRSLCLLPDDEGGARLATAHLVATGRRRIAHVSWSRAFRGGPPAARRLPRRAGRGRARRRRRPRADRAHGRSSGGVRRSRCCSPIRRRRRTESSRATTRSRAASSMPCATAASRCPTAIGVVGFDNWDVMVEAARPRLTSVDMNLYALGREAGRQIVRLIGGEAVAGRAAAALHAGRAGELRRGTATGRQEQLNAQLRTRRFHQGHALRRLLARAAGDRAQPDDPEPVREARERGAARSRCWCSTRRRRSGSRAAATASPPRSSGTAISASGSRRRAMRCATAATPRSRRRSTTSWRSSRRRSSRTAT